MAMITTQRATKENIRGGTGQADFEYLLTDKEMGNKAQMLAKIILHPHSSVGYHNHDGDNETYVILSGQGRFNDNGTWMEVKAGDVLFTDHGEGHSLENNTDEPMVFMALIFNK